MVALGRTRAPGGATKPPHTDKKSGTGANWQGCDDRLTEALPPFTDEFIKRYQPKYPIGEPEFHILGYRKCGGSVILPSSAG
ncbi:MAG: hypothetical protein NTY46_01110 [Candidatus Sumerlaeota bacterium]|nr:hypothetical protein [Candidatus Sumerlaeota bacterium]